MRLAILLFAAVPLAAGDLTTRFNLTLDRVLRGSAPAYSEAFVLADVVPLHTRRFTNFSGDVSGRYIGALSVASEAAGRQFPELARVVEGILKLQKPDGHFGDPMSTAGAVTNADMAVMWGNGRMLIGLLEYHRAHPNTAVLATARRLGDFLVGVAPLYNSDAVRREYNGEKFAVGYICWTQHLEGLVALYQATKETRYLELAKQLAARTERMPSQHSHGYLTTVRGLIDLSRTTGDRGYLNQAAREWQGVVDSGNVLLQGAVPEMFAPAIKRDEGCSEADWLRLSLDLWRATGESKYLEQAERTLFNEFRLNQFSSGDFGHHTLSAEGIAPPFARAWWCCTLHGLRAMAAVLEQSFREQNGAIWYDLPVDGRFRSPALSVRAESNLERDATVQLVITAADGKPHTLAIRQPQWASAVEPREMTRVWKAGDRVDVKYTLRTRLVHSEKGAPKVAIFHGPWLLAVDQQTSSNYFDEPSPQNRAVLPAGEEVTLAPAADRLPGHLTLRYLPGGYPMQPADAQLRPIAEFTFGPDGNRVEWWLPVQPGAEKLDSNYTVKK